MARSDIQRVLQNWIDQVLSSEGRLAQDAKPSQWVVDQFIVWWSTQVEDSLSGAERAAQCLRDHLVSADRGGDLQEALHELTHLQDALADLRSNLGLDYEESK